MNKKSPARSISESPELSAAGSRPRRPYESPQLDLYGTLAKLTRTSNQPPVTDIFIPGSGGGS